MDLGIKGPFCQIAEASFRKVFIIIDFILDLGNQILIRMNVRILSEKTVD